MRNTVLIVLLLLLSMFITTSCNAKEKLSLSSKQDIEQSWAQETAQIRKNGHKAFDDADLLGTVIETQKGKKIIISTIYREQDGANVMFGTDIQDQQSVLFSDNTIINTFEVTEESQISTDNNGSIKDIAIGSVVSIWGQYTDDAFMSDTIIVWQQ